MAYVKVSEENREKQQSCLIGDSMVKFGTSKTEVQRDVWRCLHVKYVLINTEQLAKIHTASVT
jgi:hypothetical protein